MSTSSPLPVSSPSQADVTALAAETVREIHQLKARIAAMPPVKFGFLSPRYWSLRALRHQLQAASRQLSEWRPALAKVQRPAGWVARPVGSPPGVFPRASEQETTVLIPAGTDFDALRSCLVAAVRFTSAKHRIVVLESGTGDFRISQLVQAIARKFSNVRHGCEPQPVSAVNLVNLPLATTKGDVVLLSPGAHVSSGWLPELRSAALSDKDIAIAAGGEPGGGTYLYLRRDALLALGGFDADNFSLLDEASEDLAQRAMKSGWRSKVNVNLPGSRPPGEAVTNDAALARKDARPVLMLVVFAGGGGTPKTNLDLARAVGDAWRVVVLTMSPDAWTLVEVAPAEATPLQHQHFSSISSLGDPLLLAHRTTLQRWIAALGVSVVHFRHWLGTSPEIVTVAREAGVKVIVSLHDFYAVCPALNLVDASGACCFGDCGTHTIEDQLDCDAIESWPGQSAGLRLRGDFVQTWRGRVQAAIATADALVTTNPSARDIIARTQPQIAARLTIIEHGRDFAEGRAEGLASLSPARFVFLGEATFVKGADFVVELARRALNEGLPMEFHLVGKAFVEVPELPNLIAHGTYERDSLRSTLATLRPTLILLPSRFPETYCHTLTEAWACGLPVLAHKIGALEDRLIQHGGGWLAESLDADVWLTRLDQIMNDEADWNARVQEARTATIRSIEAMTEDYRQLYASVLRTSQATASQH